MAEAMLALMLAPTATKVATATPMTATSARPMALSHAATCQRPNRPCAVRVSVRLAAMVVAMAAVMVARCQLVPDRLALVPVVNPTRCAPALT